MGKLRRVVLTSVAILGVVGLNYGASSSASSMTTEGNSLAGRSGLRADTGAFTTIKRAGTVEYVADGTTDSGTGRQIGPENGGKPGTDRERERNIDMGTGGTTDTGTGRGTGGGAGGSDTGTDGAMGTGTGGATGIGSDRTMGTGTDSMTGADMDRNRATGTGAR